MGLTPEQLARQKIDALLDAAGWKVQSMRELNLSAERGVAVRKFQTASVPIEYVLFLDRKVMGILDHVLVKM